MPPPIWEGDNAIAPGRDAQGIGCDAGDDAFDKMTVTHDADPSILEQRNSAHFGRCRQVDNACLDVYLAFTQGRAFLVLLGDKLKQGLGASACRRCSCRGPKVSTNPSLVRKVKRRSSFSRSSFSAGRSTAFAPSTKALTCNRSSRARGVGTRLLPARAGGRAVRNAPRIAISIHAFGAQPPFFRVTKNGNRHPSTDCPAKIAASPATHLAGHGSKMRPWPFRKRSPP